MGFTQNTNNTCQKCPYKLVHCSCIPRFFQVIFCKMYLLDSCIFVMTCFQYHKKSDEHCTSMVKQICDLQNGSHLYVTSQHRIKILIMPGPLPYNKGQKSHLCAVVQLSGISIRLLVVNLNITFSHLYFGILTLRQGEWRQQQRRRRLNPFIFLPEKHPFCKQR